MRRDDAAPPGPMPEPDRGTRRWAAVLVAAPLFTIVVSVALRYEVIALAVLPAEDGPVPLRVVGALWVSVPVLVLTLLAVTVRGDGSARPWARVMSVLAMIALGTVSYFPEPITSGPGFYSAVFGSAAYRVETIAEGVALGILAIACAALLSVLVLLLRFRKPPGWATWTPTEQQARTTSVSRTLGVVFLVLVILSVVVVLLAFPAGTEG